MSKTTFNFSTFSMWMISIFSGSALIVYGYLGTFSRHLADDYCSVDFIRTNFFSALWTNYLNVSDRFTNFILIALSEFVSPRSVSVLPALFIILWVAGIAWMLCEASRFSGQGWSKSTILTLTFLLVFFAILQAPNRFQILYWRSSMATHFAPLVFMPYLAAFILNSISSAAKTRLPYWKYPLGLFVAFILGGFSEPTVAIMISLLGLAIVSSWLWLKPPTRGPALNLLLWSFTGAVLALLAMAMAPGNSLRLGSPPPAIPILITRSFRYGVEFIINSFRTLLLPTLFTFFMPLLIFYNLYASPNPVRASTQQKRALIMLAVIPALAYLLVVASFFPSVYGQSYPVERARFAGQLCLVAGLMIEGALLGYLLAQLRPGIVDNLPLKLISAVLLGIAALYPLRAAWLTLAEVPEYRARAEAWDTREIQINTLIAQGNTDLLIVQLDGIHGVKELDVNQNHWVNRCAAIYYKVNSIRAVSPK
jgi:hypothetical protein